MILSTNYKKFPPTPPQTLCLVSPAIYIPVSLSLSFIPPPPPIKTAEEHGEKMAADEKPTVTLG